MPDLDTERTPSRRLWTLAAAGALALHLGCGALALAHLRTDDEDYSLGAQGIEIGLEMESPRSETPDLPPGPEADAAVASPALADQEAVDKQNDLPKAAPTETDDPDRVVTTNDPKKPNEDDPKIAAVQTSASPESAAQEATARQVFEGARQSEKSTVVNQGPGKDRLKLTADWGRRISAWFELHKRFPNVQNSRNAVVKVGLVLDRRGRVLSVAVVQSSGDRLYDQAAVAMIHRSDPVPPPPAKLTDEQFAFNLDVKFNKK